MFCLTKDKNSVTNEKIIIFNLDLNQNLSYKFDFKLLSCVQIKLLEKQCRFFHYYGHAWMISNQTLDETGPMKLELSGTFKYFLAYFALHKW